MVTLNINIEGDGKNISPPIVTNSLVQQDLPSPTAFSNVEGIESVVPSPEYFDNSLEAGLSLEAVPHPEDSGIAFATLDDQIPSPKVDSIESSNAEAKTPEPSDTENRETASPAAKRKPRATKTKTSGK